MHGLSFPSTITPVLVRHNIQEPELVIISLRRIFSHSIYYYLLYAVAFLFTLGLGWYIAVTGHEVRSLPVRDYNVFHCELGIDADKPVLRVLDVVYLEDWDATNSLCHSQGLKQFYSALELRSVHRDHFDIRELYESHYDLVLAKPELIAGGLKIAQGAIDYQEVARYPSYGSQLVSLAGTPELNTAWMEGKTLGLLDDPNSVSSYQIPRAALRNSGLRDSPRIVYFRSYRQLYKALLKGEVDVIATLYSEEGPDSALQLPPGLVLQESIPGPGWYVSGELLADPVYCEVIAALQQFSTSARVDYFRKLQIERPCNAD